MDYSRARAKLIDSILKKLVDLVLNNDYPLRSDIGIMAFYEAFSQPWINVEMSNDRKEIWGVVQLVNTKYRASGGLSLEFAKKYEDLLQGDGRAPIGSPEALQSSVIGIFDSAKRDAEITSRDKATHHMIGRAQSYCLQKLNWYIERELRRTKENALVNRLLLPANTPTNLMEDTLGRYDLGFYQTAHELYASGGKGIENLHPERIASINWNRFREEFFPSPANFEQFFWGKYLASLSKLKGYEMSTLHPQCPKSFISFGKKALQSGKLMKWGEAAYSKKQ